MPNIRLGRGAIPTPRYLLAGATPHKPLKSHPKEHITLPKKISFWGNYSDGDCVTAEEAFAKTCHHPEIFVQDQEVTAWANQHGVLQGANLVEVMNWMVAGGFAQNGKTFDDGGHLSVDWHDANILESAISEGPVKLGIGANQLENLWWANGGSASGGKNGWFAVNFGPETTEDHCVSLCGYGSIHWLAGKLSAHVPANVDGSKPGYAMFTWDSIGIIDVPSMLNITYEAWLRHPTTIVH
ncbi:MAG: hypothetical protein WCA56_20260 [Xanthobacteraceae bacterium]|jgi:hypothetical protein